LADPTAALAQLTARQAQSSEDGVSTDSQRNVHAVKAMRASGAHQRAF
jgi:hypothetical protein